MQAILCPLTVIFSSILYCVASQEDGIPTVTTASSRADQGYQEFLERAPTLRTTITDHGTFQRYLQTFNPLQPDVIQHVQHLSWLQTLLRGQDDWSNKQPQEVASLWGHFAEKGVLPQAGDDFPLRLMWHALRQENVFIQADHTRYKKPFTRTASQIHDTSRMVEAARFLSHYLRAVYQQGSTYQKKWVVLYTGYISGETYEQGYILNDNQADALVTARTYQFDARAQFIQLMNDHGIDHAFVEETNLELYSLQARIGDQWSDIELDDDTYQDLQGICRRYPNFKFEQEVANLDEQDVPTGYVQPMCHMQHPNPSIRWMAVNSAVDWVLNMPTSQDSMPFAPASFLTPSNKLALLLMLADQGIISE